MCASPGCEAAQSNKSRLRSGGFSDVCGLDRALHSVHENFEERRGTKKNTHQKEEGFDMCQQAYLLPARDGPEGMLGVSHEYDGKSADDGPERSTRLT